MIKDPFTWMKSMCKAKYLLDWPVDHPHCPNLVPANEKEKRSIEKMFDQPMDTFGVKFNEMNPDRTWDSLVELWSEWYGEYLNADFPRLIVRFEDTLLHPKEVIAAAEKCAGAARRTENSFSYVAGSSKFDHGSRTANQNMVSIIIRTISKSRRTQGMTKDDIKYANSHLSADLMKTFSYKLPDSSTLIGNEEGDLNM